MKTVNAILVVIGFALIAVMGGGCESTPLTAKDKEIYEKEQKALNYENAQQQEDFETSGDPEPQNPSGLDTERFDY